MALGVHPLMDQLNPPAAHQHAPKALDDPGRGLVLDQDPSPGPVLIAALEGTTPALVPAPTGAVPEADPAAGNIGDVGAIVVPPCQIGADTLGTGPTQTPTAAWVCLD